MEYMPPGRVVPICDPRWRRWVIKDGLGQFLAAGNHWTDDSAKALLFHRELDALAECNRSCLGDVADTFAVTAIVTVHPRWSRKALAAFLERHRQFAIGGPAEKGGILIELVPDTLKKAKP